MKIKLVLFCSIFFTSIYLYANQTTRLDEITIKSELNSSSYKTKAQSATKTDTPIFETAQSVQVITNEVLKNVAAVKMDNMLDYVSGVDRQNNLGGTWDSYSIRGFTNDNGISILKNGFADNRGFNAPRDSAIIENIEFLKGPSASLYGNSEPGGTINIVTKQAQFKPKHSVKLSNGSYDFYRVALDTTAPISEKFAYRLNVVAQKKGSFRDYVQSNTYIIAPSFSYIISDNTMITYNGDYIKQSAPLDRGIIAINKDLKAVKKNVYFGNKNDGDIVLEGYTNQLKLEHYFNEAWISRSAIVYKDNSMKGLATEISPGVKATSDSVLLRTRYRDYTSTDISFVSDIKGEFNIANAKNTLLFGVETYRFKLNSFFTNNADSLRIDNIRSKPIYTVLKTGWGTITKNDHEQQNALALFVQDNLAIGDFRFFTGARYDEIKMKITDKQTLKITKQNDDEISQRVGISYLISPQFSVYFTSASSFRPNGGLDKNGNSFKSEKGVSFESGIKFESEDKKIGATLGIYSITKKNVLTQDLTDNNFNVASGEVKSKGLEFDINGKITDNFKLNANYSYINAQITKDNQGLKGKELRNVPKHSTTLLAIYEDTIFINSSYGLGGNISYVSSKQGNSQNEFKLPSYTKVGLIYYYNYDKSLSFQLNIDNILNKDYIESSYDYSWLNPGNPRSFMFSMSYKF